MNKIFKYELQAFQHQEIKMPRQAEILTAQTQGDSIFIWAIVEPDKESEVRTIAIYGTGNELPPMNKEDRVYISTVQTGAMVWHIFEIIDNR